MKPQTPTTSPSPRRSLWKRPQGWLLILLLLLAVLIGLVPTIGQSIGPGQAKSWFAKRYQGTLELSKLDLSWTGRQKVDEVRLLDPSGKQVARAALDLPSLLDLVRSKGKRLGKVQVDFEADLEADDQGLTNLDRALAERQVEPKEKEKAKKSSSGASPLDGLDLEVELTSRRISWSDATTRQLGQPLSIENLRGHAVLRPGQPVAVDLEGGVLGKADGRLSAHAKLSELSSAAPKIELDADLAGLPSAMIDALARQDGLVRELLGPEFQLQAKGSGTLEAGELELSLVSLRTKLRFAGSIAGGVLQVRAASPLEPLLTLDQKLEAGLASVLERRFLPPGSKLTVAGASGGSSAAGAASLKARVSGVRVDLRALLDGAKQGKSPLDALASAVADVQVDLNGMGIEHPALALVGQANMKSAHVEVALAPAPGAGQSPSVLTLGGKIEGSAGKAGEASPLGLHLEFQHRGLEATALSSLDGPLGQAQFQARLSGLSPERAKSLGVPPEQALRLGGEREVSLQGEIDIGALEKSVIADVAKWPARLVGKVQVSLPAPKQLPAGANSAGSLGAVSIVVDLARAQSVAGPVVKVLGSAVLGTGGDPNVNFTAALEDWPSSWPIDWKHAASLPGVDLTAELANVDVATLEDLAAKPGLLSPYLGQRLGSARLGAVSRNGVQQLEFGLDAQGASGPQSGSTGKNSKASEVGIQAAGALEFDATANRLSVPKDKPGPDIRVSTAVLAALMPPALAGRAQFAPGQVECKLTALDLPLGPLVAQFQSAPSSASSQAAQSQIDWVKLLSGAAAKFELRAVGASDASTFVTVPEFDVALQSVRTDLSVEPRAGKSAVDAKLDCALAGGGMLKASLTAQDAAQLPLLLESKVDPVAFQVEAKAIPMALVERFALPPSAAAGASEKAGPSSKKLADSLGAHVDAQASGSVGGSENRYRVQFDASFAKAGKLGGQFSGQDLAALAKIATARDLNPVAFEFAVQGFPTQAAELWAGPGLSEKVGTSLDAAAAGTLSMAKSELTSDLSLSLSAGGKVTSAKGKVGARELFTARESLPPARVDLEFTGLELLAQFLPPARAAEINELLGDRVKLQLENRALSAKATDVSLVLEGARIKLAAGGNSENGVLRCQSGDAIELTLQPTSALLATYVGASLPPGASLRLESEQARVEMRASDIEFPFDFLMGTADGSPAPTLESAVQRGRAQIALELPALIYTHPPPAGSSGNGTDVPLRAGKVQFDLAPGKGANLVVSAQIASTPPGAIDFSARIDDPAAWVSADPVRRQTAAAQAKGSAKGLPTALIDAIAAQDGLLVDVLGNDMEFSFQGQWPSGPDRDLQANFRSPQAKLDLRANVDDMVLKAVGGQGLEAEVPLSPLFAKRIVGSLVPMLVHVSKPEGARPVGLSAKVFSLPLNGDLSKLDAEVVLDLNDILYSFLPEFDAALGLAGQAAPGSKQATLAPITLKIDKGVCRYDKLPLKIGGRDVNLKGSVDLATRKYALTTKIPLAALGSKVERELDKVRDFLDPEMLVPIEIGGTWDKPRVKIGKDFLEDVVKKAAEGALSKGLEDLLGGKKKKNDG